ncbi:hypothetical protein QZH41_008533 [Actinostola sp. cb2023]|nr:hypothetical protein QZH41_008533 [Actinostola sp. cb2023]
MLFSSRNDSQFFTPPPLPPLLLLRVAQATSFGDLEDTLWNRIQLPDAFQEIHSDLGLPEESVVSNPSTRARKRRNVAIVGGGMRVQALSASQTCEGITLEWTPVSLPFSTDLQYTHSEFKHYNVYRSNAFFNDVTGMTPYASGLTDPRLRHVETTKWMDRYPSAMVDWFYAVTIVNGKDKEEKSVTAKKVMFVGAIEKQGKPFLMVPSMLRRGRVMHHSVAYNPTRNEYLVVFDWDANYDGISDNVFALRMNQAARIVDKNVLNMTANLPGWIGGGYVATIIADKAKKDIVVLFLNELGNLLIAKPVCTFKTDAYEHNLFLDSKRSEFYLTCSLERKGASADFQLEKRPFLVLMTKMNATGGLAGNTPSSDRKTLIGYSAKRYNRHEGYYNDKTDRLVLFWEDTKNGRSTISSASVIMTRQFFKRDDTKYKCPITREVKTPVALPMSISGGHYLLWQERSQLSWKIGGNLMKGNFQLTQGVQKDPALVYNTVRDMGFVVWKEDIGRNVRIIGRHFMRSTSHSCSPGCAANQKCAMQDTCVSDRCAANNGGCSHVCTNIKGGDTSCSCPAYMKLQDDQKTCKDIPPCQGMTPLRNPLTDKELFCGRGPFSVACPKHSYCHVHPTDAFAKCCPDSQTVFLLVNHAELLSEFTVLLASQGVIWRAVVNQNQRKVKIERMPFTQGIMIVAVSYDPKDKRMYWSDVDLGVIKRAYMDGTGEETILTLVRVPDGMCLDVEDREIYWTDTGFNRIEKAQLDGSFKKTLVDSGLDEPRAIVLYKKRRQMYWSDWGKAAKIERALMDGTQRKTIISGGLVWPNGLTIDEVQGVLYWADAKEDKIETSDLEGRNRRVLVGNTIAKHPFSLAILNDRLFWSDWETTGLQSVNKRTGKDLVHSLKGLVKPKGMCLFFTKSPSAKICLDPGSPQNGGRHPAPDSSASYPIGTTLIFTCRPGYTMLGPARRICLKSGKWSKQTTLCKVGVDTLRCFISTNFEVFCKVPPVLTALPVNKTVDEGDSVVLKCSASAQGKRIKVKWYKNWSPLLQSDDMSYFVGMNGHLVFLSTRFDDRGFYKCVAENKAGKVSATAYLGVRGKIKLRGEPRYKTRARIIGGRRADRGAHPWQVMLWNKSKGKHFCGGTLVSDSWVLTAAHCVSKILVPSNVRLRLGKHVRTRSEKNEQSIDADMIQIHPNFDLTIYDSDIALIRMSKKVIFTDYIQPICLPSSASDFSLVSVNHTGTISGWGSRKEGRRPAIRLHETTIPIVDQASCTASHRPKYIVTANMFCAGYKNSSIGDACQGDSGGPFSVNNPDPSTPLQARHVLMGVVSWGDGCGQYGKYGVYTRLTNFVEWVMKLII